MASIQAKRRPQFNGFFFFSIFVFHSPGEVEIGTTPSNYTEFYDDDEKQLIASIENDFIPLSPPALPGSVM